MTAERTLYGWAAANWPRIKVAAKVAAAFIASHHIAAQAAGQGWVVHWSHWIVTYGGGLAAAVWAAWSAQPSAPSKASK